MLFQVLTYLHKIHKRLPKRIFKHEGKHSSLIVVCVSHPLADETEELQGVESKSNTKMKILRQQL